MNNYYTFSISLLNIVYMRFFKNLKTSQKITTLFGIFNFVSLLLLLLCINIIYFYIWYSDQKEESLYDMNTNYKTIVWEWSTNTEAFKKYILQKDTIIIPKKGEELVCSEWVAKKLHNNMEILEEVKDSLFYKVDGKVYLIFSREYNDIWEVKILFDTTPYIKSQIIIIKISLILIILFLLLHFLWGRIISKYALKSLRKISNFAWEVDLDKKVKKIKIIAPDNDEIKIVANALNNSFSKIKDQSKNQKQFITDVSHEFKTPLMWINSKIDLYNKKCEKWSCSPNELQNLLLSIKTSTKKLNTLLETLFLFSRMQDWITVFDKQDIDLWKYIAQETDSIISSYGDRSIDVTYKLDENIVVAIDNSTFWILLDNLLTNAIKFSPDPVRIEVWLTKKSFWIADNGIWIPTRQLDKIWEKFYRSDLGKEGFWVWLFIVKRVVELYGWKIKVKSKKSQWSKFEVFFK